MKKKLIIIFIFIMIISCYILSKNNNTEALYELENKTNDNVLSMMLETSAGSGEYQETMASSWPTEGYVFNETLSKCKNGSILSWDNKNKQVIFDGINKDECYIYFDKGIILSEYIKSLYTTQGSNNLYFHDSSLENGAGDNSYRYAGSSETTNNFVCFGYDSTDGTCPTDYLYRIIGVFDNQVKLIKYDYAKSTLLGMNGDYSNTYQAYCSVGCGSNKGNNALAEIGVYYWNNSNGSSSINTWGESRLNTLNLNINYLDNIGLKWSDKIATHKWKVGGNAYDNIANATVINSYRNEITSPAENITYDAKIGLMYVSDYGYAASPSAWTKQLYNSDENDYRLLEVININWMHMGLIEWTITRRSDLLNAVLGVSDVGYMGNNYVYVNFAIRPTFYLNLDVTYLSGNGTKPEPILIK